MLKILNKNIKWRIERKKIFICDCKLLRNLILHKKYMSLMKKFYFGFAKENLGENEIVLYNDFEKLNMFSNLCIRVINKNEFNIAWDILNEGLGKNRVRGRSFLKKKFMEFPLFFRGIFLDDELVGVIFGFPREDYLLISELVIKTKFQERKFGEKLVNDFEFLAKSKGYSKIKVGAMDDVLGFYSKLGYFPFLLIQFKEGIYSSKDFLLEIIKEGILDKEHFIEAKVNSFSKHTLDFLRKKFPLAHFQYIFTKYFEK